MIRSDLSLGDFLNAVLPPLLWAGLIYFLSDQSALPSPDSWQLDFLFKKGAHMFVYAVLYILLWRGSSILLQPKHSQLRWSVPFVIALLYAITDELHQSLVPGRSPTMRDLGFDILGMSIAFLWWYRYV